jgi:LysM repeat protein
MTTPSLTRRGYRKALPALMAGLALAGCASQEPAPIVYRGGANPAASAPAAPAPAPLPAPQPVATDASGVVDYGGYSAMIARNGDTVESMAARVGLSASELASYNGLPSGYQPRAGDELILPPRPEGYAVSNPVAPAPVETASLDPEAPAAPAAAGAATGAFEPAPSARPSPADSTSTGSRPRSTSRRRARSRRPRTPRRRPPDRKPLNRNPPRRNRFSLSRQPPPRRRRRSPRRRRRRASSRRSTRPSRAASARAATASITPPAPERRSRPPATARSRWFRTVSAATGPSC